MKSEIERIIEMINVLNETAKGNYDIQLASSHQDDDLNQLSEVINKVIDSLKNQTVRLDYVDQRINQILETIQHVANGDYSASCNLSIEKDIFDALAFGVNMRKDDIKSGIEEIERKNKRLMQSNKEYKALHDEYKSQNKKLLRAKEKAEESDRLKSAFLSNMSHEIRTPMNGIIGFSKLLKNPKLNGNKRQKYIDIIEKAGHRMLNTINEIINISKIESGLVDISITEVNINKKIEEMYQFFKSETDKKAIHFSCNNKLPAQAVIIKSDEDKISAILTNLIKNAIKFTNQGEIIIGCISKEQHLEFSVKDTGIGIPIDRQKAIFNRFEQGDIEDKLAFQGSGLGLTISKAYVEILGGTIWLESLVGKGSIFYFTVPMKH